MWQTLLPRGQLTARLLPGDDENELVILALAAGAFITIQAGSNSQLKKTFGVPMPAVIVNYLVGLACIIFYTFIKRDPVPTLARTTAVPCWGWMGGGFGAVYGVAAVILASQMGAATLMALVVTGQLICSVLLDHFGWMGFEVHSASLWRICGCALMVTGFVLIAKS
jgi:transporter family-2 protein